MHGQHVRDLYRPRIAVLHLMGPEVVSDDPQSSASWK